jgi:hypothetical protein
MKKVNLFIIAVIVAVMVSCSSSNSEKDKISIIQQRLVQKSLGQIKEFDVTVLKSDSGSVYAKWSFFNPLIEKNVECEGKFWIQKNEVVKDTVINFKILE